LLKRIVSFIIIICLAATARAAQIRPMQISCDHDGIVRGKGTLGFAFCEGRLRRIPPDKGPAGYPAAPPLRVNLSMRFSGEIEKFPVPAGVPPARKTVAQEKSRRPAAGFSAAASTPATPAARAAHTVYFRFGKSSIARFEQDQLEKMIPCLKELRAPVAVEGFTCRIGARNVNDRLARARAEAVGKYLEQRGFRVERCSGRGNRDYISSEDPLNRRVEIKILQKGDRI